MKTRQKSCAVIGAIVLILGLWFASPFRPGHVGAMISEGYPGAVLEPGGRYATVSGRQQDLAPNRTSDITGKLSDPLLKLFTESDGRAIIVSHKGRIVLEHYAEGYSQETRFNSFSMIKSLVGALTLQAIDQGRIKQSANVGELLGLTTGSSSANVPRWIGRVSLRELLEMRTGIHYQALGGWWTSPMSSPKDKDLERTLFNPLGPMARLHFDGLDAIANNLVTVRRDGQRPPFNYQNVNTALLGAALSRAWKKDLQDILSEQLWIPAGAGSAHWRKHPEGQVSAYCCLFATVRDWDRVGHFILRNGERGEAFLKPRTWHRFLKPNRTDAEFAKGVYGLHIRHDILNRPGEPIQGQFSYMMGQGGQTLYLMPSHDLVVVRFGGQHQKLHSTLYEVWRQIMSAQQTQ